MKGKNYGIEPRNAEQSFALRFLNDPNGKLVALTGKAGTGKTLLALAAALGQTDRLQQILLARPVVAFQQGYRLPSGRRAGESGSLYAAAIRQLERDKTPVCCQLY